MRARTIIPFSEDRSRRKVRKGGLYAYLADRTDDFVEYNGFLIARSIRGQGALFEYAACRSHTALVDLSALRKFDISGPDAEALLQLCLTRDVAKAKVGRVLYSAMCFEGGGVIDDGTLYRLENGRYRWVCNLDASGRWFRQQAARRGLNVLVEDLTDRQSTIAVQGRGARDILGAVCEVLDGWPQIEGLGWFQFTMARIGGKGAVCLVSRTGYTGELGFEIFCNPASAPAVERALSVAGEPHGLAPIGMRALDALRIEAGLPFLGEDFNAQTDPFEGGLGFAVDLDKPGEFFGKAALVARQKAPRQRLVGLLVDGAVAPASGDPVFLDDVQIGTITSATVSLTLKRTIAMAHIRASHGAAGEAVVVGKFDNPLKRRAAVVTTLPFIDPQRLRIRGEYAS